ncbi:Histidine-containing phosphotransfer protein 5 [Tetrabaena socialis]|uniref:Histidine-containing phosphotransfer protein n=1 Tax=Tetrabaena socialis TaxID=47790 RepID=A0A2J7ZV87_9CHLO|nr:Histidine-containing phosphotransfer protein 5 [Tetrabaena socialis]|eukprot:PNH04169.1 Histidine-containing phosphotransfer protein 5 [Tetrabaena socialis]
MEANVAAVEESINILVAQLQQEGTLDEQFEQLMALQDDANPDFVAEVVQLYFEDSVQKIDRMGAMLSPPVPDFKELDQLVHQFKGSSASLGAATIAHLCIKMREGCQTLDQQMCTALLGQLRDSYLLLKGKLDMFMALEQQRKQLVAALAMGGR